MDHANAADTPMSSTMQLDIEVKGPYFNITKYREIINYLMYLTASIPNIQFSIGICVRYQYATKESHTETVKEYKDILLTQLNLVYGI